VPAALRALLLGVFLLGALGTAAELVLLEHYEDPWQWAPLALLGAGLLAVGLLHARPTAALVRLVRALMGLFVASGAVGVALHLKGNVEFELEMQPSLAGLALAWEALRGATPALAPGTMLQLGLVGLAYTYRHPARADRARAIRPAAPTDP
jgi:hypothetical protein